MAVTKLSNLINPEVMADMISAQLSKRIKFSPIAQIDRTLEGHEGKTITVPKFGYIGDADDVAEGTDIDIAQLTATTTTATIKKAGKGVEITDEALLSAHGNPKGEATAQLAKAISAKVDNDCYDALMGATLTYDGTSAVIGYDAIVDASAKFGDEETDTEKILFINPAQEATLLKDDDFMSKDKYPLDVVMTGTIGKIAGCQVVKSKKVKLVKYVKDNTSGTITIVSDATTEDSTNKHLSTIMANCIDYTLEVGDKVATTTNFYACPIVVVDEHDPNEAPTADGFEEEKPVLSIYMKRNVLVETDRDIVKKTTVITADEHYVAVLSNDSKAVLAKFKA